MNEADRILSPEQLKAHYAWAIKIVKRHFEEGLARVSDKLFLEQRYGEFKRKNDAIYADLLGGMGDDELAKTFVSYWVIAQTIATQSRFWLEAAMAEIVIHQAKHRLRHATEVYSHAMLAQRFPTWRRAIDQIGEFELQDLAESSPWRVPLPRNVLQMIDVMVGEQEREAPSVRQRFRRRQWSPEDNEWARDRDRKYLAEVANSPPAALYDLTPLHCNLLVIEPAGHNGHEVQVWAIRFVNPKTIAQHATRKQERVNLLRLSAWLVQENLVPRRPSIHIHVAELVPRHVSWEWLDHYPDYFSPLTYWSSERLWDFIGVPFGVVQVAIRDVARQVEGWFVKAAARAGRDVCEVRRPRDTP